MGRPWWYDDYWKKQQPPRKRFQLPGRRILAWLAVIALAVLLTAAGNSFRPALVPWLSGFVGNLCRILSMVIFIRAILSWFGLGRYNLLLLILDDISEPILRPLRRIIPAMGGFDFTPVIALVVLYVIPIVFDNLLFAFVR